MGYLLEVIGEEEEVEAPNLKHEIRNGKKFQDSRMQFQGKTEDQETEEARSEAVTHTFSILDFQDFSFYLTAARPCFNKHSGTYRIQMNRAIPLASSGSNS